VNRLTCEQQQPIAVSNSFYLIPPCGSPSGQCLAPRAGCFPYRSGESWELRKVKTAACREAIRGWRLFEALSQAAQS
jgi:hypothetical protein